MKVLRKLILVLMTVFLVAAFPASGFAQSINLAEWNQLEETIVLAEDGVNTNSGLKNALMKVKYDYPSHRMTMLFMLRYNSFTDGENIGMSFNINGGDEIVLHLNGSLEYNEESYFAEFLTASTPTAGVVYFEIVLGIKEGIPEQQLLTAKFYDPDGVVSNTLTADLTPQEEPAHGEETSVRTTRTNKSKVTGTKNPGKEKSTTTKKTEKDGIAVVYNSPADNDSNYPVNKVLCISAAAIVATVVALFGGRHFLKRKTHRGDED